MLYFNDSLYVLSLFSNTSDILDYELINKKVDYKDSDLRHLLGYMLYIGYIDLHQGKYIMTPYGSKFFKSFKDYKKETLLILDRLRTSFPQALTKKECAEGVQSLAFPDIIGCLKDKGYIQLASTVTNHEMIRISELGFNILDYFTIQDKLSQIMD